MVAFAGCPDHGGALCHSDLDCRAAHASGGALDEKGAPREASERVQATHRGHGRETGARSLLIVPRVGA